MQALLTEDVEAVQKLRVLVRVQADCTVELFFHLFQSIFNSSELRSGRRELGSHCLERGEGKARRQGLHQLQISNDYITHPGVHYLETIV